MRTSRFVLTLGYKTITYPDGVPTPSITEKAVKAEQEQVYQSRKDRAYADGRVISARFRVRLDLSSLELEYVFWNGKKYKVSSTNEMVDTHFSIIELGELV